MVEPVSNRDLGLRVRAARESKGYSQSQLAEHVGASVETISRIERAAVWPTVLIAARIADVLDLGLDELVRGGRPERQPAERRALQRVLRLLEPLDDRALSSLGDFLARLAGPRRRRGGKSVRS